MPNGFTRFRSKQFDVEAIEWDGTSLTWERIIAKLPEEYSTECHVIKKHRGSKYTRLKLIEKHHTGGETSEFVEEGEWVAFRRMPEYIQVFVTSKDSLGRFYWEVKD